MKISNPYLAPIKNSARGFFSLTVLDARLLTCLSLVWKWPSAVYSCITLAQVVSIATVQYQM